MSAAAPTAKCPKSPGRPKSRCALQVAIATTWWLVYRTRIGAVLRATAVDPSMVASFGIPIRLVYGLTFMYGCGLAGLPGVLLSPIYAVFPTMGHDFLVMAFAVVIVGGSPIARMSYGGARTTPSTTIPVLSAVSTK